MLSLHKDALGVPIQRLGNVTLLLNRLQLLVKLDLLFYWFQNFEFGARGWAVIFLHSFGLFWVSLHTAGVFAVSNAVQGVKNVLRNVVSCYFWPKLATCKSWHALVLSERSSEVIWLNRNILIRPGQPYAPIDCIETKFSKISVQTWSEVDYWVRVKKLFLRSVVWA